MSELRIPDLLLSGAEETVETIVLGSSSPRRRELVSLLFPDAPLLVLPPADNQEEELNGPLSRPQIEHGLLQIVQHKTNQVRQQLAERSWDYLLTADTCVVVGETGGLLRVLSKPVEAEFPQQVRDWFNRYYREQSHQVLTALQWTRRGGPTHSRVVSTQVRMAAFTDAQLEWYLETKESLGKAGGYAMQGLGSCLISQVEGSLSNVVGLPLWETWELFQQLRPPAKTS